MLSGMKQTTDDPFLRFLGLTAGNSPHGDLLAEFIETVLRARDLDRGDLKILHRAVRELRYAFSVFERYRQVPKGTAFGSARSRRECPIYHIATAFSRRIVDAGFIAITRGRDGL